MDEMRIYEAAESLRNQDYLAFLDLDQETRDIWYKIHKRKERGEDNGKARRSIFGLLLDWLDG